jgi:hypothetical protein
MLEKTRTIVLGGAGVAYFEHPGIFESYSVTELTDWGLKQLVAAVIRQALVDAANGDEDARAWLSAVGSTWSQIAGFGIVTTPGGIERAIQRKQQDGRGRHRPGRAAQGMG